MHFTIHAHIGLTKYIEFYMIFYIKPAFKHNNINHKL